MTISTEDLSGNFLHQSELRLGGCFSICTEHKLIDVRLDAQARTKNFHFPCLCWEISTRLAHILMIFFSQLQRSRKQLSLVLRREENNEKHKRRYIAACVYSHVSTAMV